MLRHGEWFVGEASETPHCPSGRDGRDRGSQNVRAPRREIEENRCPPRNSKRDLEGDDRPQYPQTGTPEEDHAAGAGTDE